MGRPIADVIQDQVIRGLSDPAGLGVSGRRYVATVSSKFERTKRSVAAAGAPFVSMELVTEPFQRQVQRLVSRAAPKQASATIGAIAMELLARVSVRTPIGDTGLARATWIASRQSVGEVAGRDITGITTTRPVSRHGNLVDAAMEVDTTTKLWPSARSSFLVEVRNNLEYIVPLEYGWSGQAPLGMVRITFAEMQGLGPRAMGEVFRAEWLEAMLQAGKELGRRPRPFRRKVGSKVLRGLTI